MFRRTRQRPFIGIGPPAGIVFAMAIFMLPGCATEQSYPGRPITLIVPWSKGGGTDLVSRQMAIHLERELGVQVNVLNATGGRGVTGHSRGLNARPDGYTLLMMTVELNMLHHQDLTSITWQDAEPLMSVNEDAAALFVRADSPWKTLKELEAEIGKRAEAYRRDSGDDNRLTASGTASGGIWHVALVGWLQAAGLEPDDVKWIPMNGAAPSIQELVSGGIDLVCASLPEARTQLKAGEIRSLGVMGEQRVPGFDDVPTLAEAGTEWTTVGWRGLGVPKGTPPERVEVLVAAIRKVVEGKTEIEGQTFPEFMQAQSFNNRYRESEEFAVFLEDNDTKYGELLRGEAFADLSQTGYGPWVFPSLLGVAGFLILGALLVVSVRRSSESKRGNTLTLDGVINACLMIIVVLSFFFFAETVGFVLLMSMAMFLLLWRLKTPLLTALVISLIFVPAVYHLFVHLFRVPLPRGWFGW